MKLLRHQQELVDATWHLPGYAIFDEMGAGKSFSAIATAQRLFDAKKITRMLWVAPNMVHANFVNDELPKHSLYGVIYDCARAGSTRWLRNLGREITHSAGTGIAIMSVSYDAILTANGLSQVEAFLNEPAAVGCGTLMVLDESARIKNPQAKRTKAILKLGQLATYRRILTGTPVANSPFDVYTQIQFVDPNFWKENGIGSYWAFRTRFGVFKQEYVHINGVRRPFQKLLGYQNMPELQAILKKISRRVLKSEVLDLPPIIFTTRTFDLPKAQREMYAILGDQFYIEACQTETISGRRGEPREKFLMTAPLALTRLLRLQQIASGFWRPDFCDVGIEGDVTFKQNPRIDLLHEITEDMDMPCIIWTRFTRTTNAAMELLGDRAVRYDGETSNEDRAKAIEAFQSGAKQFFVSKPSCGGEGLNLTRAQTMIFAENSFSLTERRQAAARAHRIGQTNSLHIIDLCARDTVDCKIAKALQTKQQLSDEVLGDPVTFLLSL